MVCINEPQLLPLQFGDVFHRPTWYHRTTLSTHDGSELNLHEYVDNVTAELLPEVQRLSALYTATATYASPEEALSVLSHVTSVLERLLQSTRNQNDDPSLTGLVCRMAAALHVFVPFSGYFPSPFLMITGLTVELKSSLAKLILTGNPPSDLLLWLLSIGGASAHRHPDLRFWFVSQLVVVMTDIGVRSWEDMRRYLVHFAMHSNWCEEGFYGLWQDTFRQLEVLDIDRSGDVSQVPGRTPWTVSFRHP